MKKKVIIILTVVIIGAGACWLWSKRYEYFFKGNLKEKQELVQPSQSNGSNDQDSQPNTGPLVEPTNLSAITADDCNQGCESKKNTDQYDYCREICGFNEDATKANNNDQSSQNEETTDCEALSGINKDVCYKREAIAKKNSEVCKKISDSQLKEGCLNRVVEEIMD